MIKKKVNLYDITTKVDESMKEAIKDIESNVDKYGKERYRKIRDESEPLEKQIGARFVRKV